MYKNVMSFLNILYLSEDYSASKVHHELVSRFVTLGHDVTVFSVVIRNIKPVADIVFNVILDFRLFQSFFKLFFIKVRKINTRKIKFRISRLPYKIVRQSIFAAWPYNKIGVARQGIFAC